MVYKFRIKGNKILPCENVDGVSGNLNYYTCCFDFDGTWDGLTKFAVFSKGDETVSLMLDGDSCLIPHELTADPCALSVGVYASNLSEENPLRITSDFSHIILKEGAYREADAPKVPQADLWEVYFERAAKKASDVAVDAANEAADAATDKINALNAEAKAEVEVHIKKVDNTLGDISAALDHIIEIQNTLMGGEI